MSGVPYLYINVIALCSYTLIFTAFIASRKTRTIWSFILVLAGFMLWTGGSILMRLQVYPGVPFWYYVSILALFSLAYLIYLFVSNFTGSRGFFMKLVWGVGTLVILVLTTFGLFLAPPEVVTENGQTVFLYSMGWPVAIPFAFFLLIVVSIAGLFRSVIRERGLRSPGIVAILGGCVSVVLGNLLQIIPGNIFPWDTLSGIFFALFLMYALYRRHMFRLTLQVSRSVVLTVSTAVVVMAGVNLFTPVEGWVTQHIPTAAEYANTVALVLFALCLWLVTAVIRRMMDALYTSEERRNLLVKSFTDDVASCLKTEEVMRRLVHTIGQEIAVERIYVCLPDKDGSFRARYSAEPLRQTAFSLRRDCPLLRRLEGGEAFLLLEEFENTPMALSLWQEERALFRSLELQCAVPLRRENRTVGLVLLGPRKRGHLTYPELDFLATLSAVASIAVENAELYERMFREARTDSLTGVWNYTYFVESLNSQFRLCGRSALSLLYVDIDDFKLYNQLYGTKDGDWVLCRVAEAMTRCAGETGQVFRCGGKVFALLLPERDLREANSIAHSVQQRIAQINTRPGRTDRKTVTVSMGLCSAPCAAASAKELMDNADLAVYTAKNKGKGNITVFHGGDSSSSALPERAMEIVERCRAQCGSELDTSLSTIYALTAAIDAKDHYTYAHSQNVARYSAIVALAAGLSDEQITMIYEAGLLHDIGKISIPESILGKSGRLDKGEYEVIKTHVNNSIEMIRHLPSMDYLLPCAVGHHERWDGGGYPRGLKGEEIPLPARCLAVADAFDAMTSDRPYRRAMDAEEAATQLESGAGTQFDPRIARLFVELVRSGEITISVGREAHA